MSSLRARQKEDRRNRIVSSAKRLFKEKGYEKTTIENIAFAAGVSGVTVHNYYGTKAGVLLALVIESDERLIERLDVSLAHEGGGLIDLTLSFARQIMDHAIKNLEKDIWRQVIAAVTIEAGTQLSKAYSQLDEQHRKRVVVLGYGPARDLFPHKLVVRLVFIKRTHDVVAIDPGVLAIQIRLRAVGLGPTNHVQPMLGPAFAKVG